MLKKSKIAVTKRLGFPEVIMPGLYSRQSVLGNYMSMIYILWPDNGRAILHINPLKSVTKKYLIALFRWLNFYECKILS